MRQATDAAKPEVGQIFCNAKAVSAMQRPLDINRPNSKSPMVERH
jgi:hypothetical protein